MFCMEPSTVDPAEAARIEALDRLGVVGTPREDRYDRMMRLAQRMFDVPIAAVTLVDADRQWLKAEVGLEGLAHMPRDESFCQYTIQTPETLVVADAGSDPRFQDLPVVTAGPHIRFYAGHPLRAPGGERLGSLCLLDTEPREFGPQDRQLLQEMAGWVEHELTLQRGIDEAARVQRKLMPGAPLDVPGYRMAAECVPTLEVGGDFAAWQTLPEGTLHLQVGDVMGKGVTTALLAASVRAALMTTSLFKDQHETITRAAAATHDMLQDDAAFATVFSAQLDPATGRLEYVNAGHGLAFVFSAGGYRRLERSGLPLGVRRDSVWDAHTTALGPGETLVVVSDGFLDFSPAVEEVLVEATAGGPADLSARAVVDRAAAYARTHEHTDDVTVVALHRTAG